METEGSRAYELTGFESLRTYATALSSLPSWHRICHRQSAQAQMDMRAESKAEMHRCLGAMDLTCMGVGMMLGAGVFVTTGFVAATLAGPAVIVSYVVAGLSALLSSLCYAELATQVPLSGGAYAYVSAVFGEFAAWIVVANLILEYILANAAAIRGFAPYFAVLVNRDVSLFVTPFRGYNLDWWAFGWILLLTALLTFGTKESSRFNLMLTVVHVLLVVFIIVAGFTKADISNAQPFVPFELRGVFNGAALVFFSYIGFDAVACAAEEVKNPRRDLPLGILGALGVVTCFYVLMAAALVLMVPISAIDLAAPFAAAFRTVNMDWARYIVALGALLGIVTTTLVGLYATSRIIAAVARQHMLPPFLALVHPRFGTPHVATILSGVAAAVIALFTDFADLADMVSISTLFAFWACALALIWNRGYKRGATPRRDSRRLGALMALLIAASLGFTICYQLSTEDGSPALTWVGMPVCGAAWAAATLAIQFGCTAWNAPAVLDAYASPLFPWVPALSVALNTFLLGCLDVRAYERFGIWTAFVALFYVVYSSPAAAHREARSSSLPLIKGVGGGGGDDDDIAAAKARAAAAAAVGDNGKGGGRHMAAAAP